MLIKNTDFSIKVSDDDILSFPHHGPFTLPSQFQVVHLKNLLVKRLHSLFDHYGDSAIVLLCEGMICELLKQEDLSCQTGKLKITVKFVPDIVEVPDIIEPLPQIQASKEVKHESSPLDAFR
jgi:hypothetical protein